MADICFQYGPFFRQYGVATSSGGANSHIQAGIATFNNANLYTSTLASGDVKVSKDGGAEANITTLPTQIGSSGVWVFALSATELQCATLTIHVKKAGVTAELVFTVETNLALGRVSVDATAIGGNVSAIAATGVGTGNGFTGTAGGSGKICNFFDTIQAAEPAAAPASTDTYGTILQHLARRFFNKCTQTASTFSRYKDDSSTILFTRSASDDGTTQTLNKAS